MCVRPIVLYASSPELLRRKSDPFAEGTDDARRLLVDLKDTLRSHGNGVGLAAPQIGLHKRAIAVCLGASSEGRRGPSK